MWAPTPDYGSRGALRGLGGRALRRSTVGHVWVQPPAAAGVAPPLAAGASSRHVGKPECVRARPAGAGGLGLGRPGYAPAACGGHAMRTQCSSCRRASHRCEPLDLGAARARADLAARRAHLTRRATPVAGRAHGDVCACRGAGGTAPPGSGRVRGAPPGRGRAPWRTAESSPWGRRRGLPAVCFRVLLVQATSRFICLRGFPCMDHMLLSIFHVLVLLGGPPPARSMERHARGAGAAGPAAVGRRRDRAIPTRRRASPCT